MISNLVIYNQNISGIPDTFETEYDNAVITVRSIRNSILGILPHFYCVSINEKLYFQEKKYSDIQTNEEIDIKIYKDSLSTFLNKFIPEKLRKIQKKICLVRFYFMINKIDKAVLVLSTMKNRPDVRMLKFLIFYKLKENSVIPRLLSTDAEEEIFMEFREICMELDLHSMLLFILEFIDSFRSEYYLKIDLIISDRVSSLRHNKAKDDKIINKKQSKKDVVFDDRIENVFDVKICHSLQDLENIHLKDTTNFEKTISYLIIYIKLQISNILFQRGSSGLASLFYFRTSMGIFDTKNAQLKVFLLAKAFELCKFGEAWKAELFDCFLDMEIFQNSFLLGHSAVDKFYILNSQKIREQKIFKANESLNDSCVHFLEKNERNSSSDGYDKAKCQNHNISTSESYKISNLKENINEIRYIEIDSHKFRIKVYGSEEIFEFNVVMNKLDYAFTDKIVVEIRNLPFERIYVVGIISDDNTFYPAVSMSEFYYLFPDTSLTIKKLIFSNGEAFDINFSLKKITKSTDLILKEILSDSYHSSLSKEIRDQIFTIVKTYFNNTRYKILVFTGLDGVLNGYFAITDCKSIKQGNAVYFIVDANVNVFEVDVEICSNIYQKRKIQISPYI